MISYFERFENIQYLHYVWTIIPLIILFILNFRKKNKALEIFAKLKVLKQISFNTSISKQKIKAGILICSIIFFTLSLMRPQGDPEQEEIKNEGRNIIFLLDVSESMNAKDLKPTRLERAKLAIHDLIDKLHGDKVGLVVFAGNTSLKSPLTSDYGFFSHILKNISTFDIAEPGTNIGDAIRKAEELFDNKKKQYKDIILITDGEDQNSFPIKAAERAAGKGIRLFTVGLGDPDMGALVTIDEDHSEDSNHRSKLNIPLLQEIALAHPDGAFLPVKTGNFDLGKIYFSKIANAAKTELYSSKTIRWKEFYQIPLFLGILLLLLEVTISETKRKIKGINKK